MGYETDRIKEQIRERLEQYLQEHGIVTSGKFTCQSATHPGIDEHPSMSLNRQGGQIPTVAHCFSCNAGMDIFHFIEKFEGIRGFPAQLAWAKEYFGIGDKEGASKMSHKPQNDGKGISTQKGATNAPMAISEPVGAIPGLEALVSAWHKHIGETSYHRGLSDQILKEYRLGYDPDFIYHGKGKGGKEYKLKAGPSLMIPFPGESYYIARPLEPGKYETKKDDKYLKPQGVTQPLFNERWLRDPDDEPLFIVEGPLDALSIEDVGFHAVALVGTATKRLKDLIKEALEKQPGKVYVLCLDNDPKDGKGMSPGKVVMDKLEKDLIELGARVYRPRAEDEAGNVDREGIEGTYKDANDALTENRPGFEVAVAKAWEDALSYGVELDKKEREEYLSTSAGACIEAIRKEIEESKNLPALETGFPKLDTLLEDGLQEGLYVLGAVTGAGKTTLALQIGDNVAKNGTDVIIFSLEMGRKELMAKSVSRLTYDPLDPNSWPYAKTTPGIMRGQRYLNYTQKDKEVIEAAWSAYSKYADKIFIYEGVGDMSPEFMRKKVEEHIKISECKHPLVIVDYLQITSSDGEDRLTDKQKIDNAVVYIKRMSRDLHIPVIVVSSFNRAGYNEAVAMESMKETGAIEYSCDVLMALGLTAIEAVNADSETSRKKEIAKAKKEAREEAERTKDLKLSLVILKNRNGKTGEVPLIFHTPNNHFRSV